MKNKIIILICYSVIGLLVYTPTKSQNPFIVELKFQAIDSVGKPVVKLPLSVGIDTRATDSVDYNLGEKDFPQHPPSGFHAGIVIVAEGGTGVSYKDYRRIPPQKKFMKEYELDVTPLEYRANDPFYITWEYPLDKYIDSAHFTDRLDGSLVFFRFDSNKSCTSITSPLKKYYIRVWYNVESATTSSEDIIADSDNVFYSIQDEVIRINSDVKSRVTLYSSLASTLYSAEMAQPEDEINVRNLETGVYFLALQKPNGMVSNHKIMIIR